MSVDKPEIIECERCRCPHELDSSLDDAYLCDACFEKGWEYYNARYHSKPDTK